MLLVNRSGIEPPGNSVLKTVGADRRSRLRAATSTLHQRVDAQVDKMGFTDSCDGYRGYLMRTLEVRRLIERSLDSSGAQYIYPAWPQRRICAAIELDLADLGMTAKEDRPVEKLTFGRGGILGALYVLEGSSLGARIIARRVASLGALANFGARHLSLQTADPKAFGAFLVSLENTPLNGEEEAECTSAAIKTFNLFERAYSA